VPELLSLLAGLGPAFELTTVRGMVGVLFGVGALIFFHELGHFLAAKWAGVRVEVFSLGFGPRLLGVRKGDTDYRVSALPLGGYVRMLGQADDDPFQAPTERADDFRNKTPWQRFVILVAGVVMNIVLAAVGFIAAFGLGVEFVAPEIGAISPGSPAARADLRPGDVVVRIDDDEVLGWQDLQTLVALADEEIELEVLRGGERITTHATPIRGDDDSYARLGVEPAFVIAEFEEGSPLPELGVEAATPAAADRIRNVSPVDSRCDPELRMKQREIAEAIERADGRVAIVLERVEYADDGTPGSSEPSTIEVDVPQEAEYTIGLEIPDHAWVRGVTEGGAAAAAGVAAGDRIVALGELEPITHSNLREAVRETGARRGDAAVRLVVERDGERVETEVRLQLMNPDVVEAAVAGVSDEAERLEIRRNVGRWLLGVEYRQDIVGADARLPLADADADPVTIEAGDRLTKLWLDGGLWWSQEVPFSSADVLEQILRQRQDEPFQLAWIDGDTGEERTAVVQANESDERYGDLGFSRSYRQVVVQRGPLAAIGLGLHQTVIQTQRIFLMLRSFMTGGVSPKELGGPIQIAKVAYTVAERDSLSKLFHLLAILSVNLAVINILPIPVLDGGHILFLVIEKLKGRPVSSDVMAYAQWFGLFVILGLMALVFFNDIRRIVQQ